MPRPSPTAIASPRRVRRAGAAAWAATDVALILVFAAGGRRTHEHGVSAVGVLETAWPFLLAYGLTAIALRAWRSPAAFWPTAVVLWLATVALGLSVRALSGAGVALSFQVVALLVLGGLLLLPRLVARLFVGRRRPVT